MHVSCRPVQSRYVIALWWAFLLEICVLTLVSCDGSLADALHGQVAASKAEEAAKNLKKKAAKSKQEGMHLFAKTPSEDTLLARIHTWSEKIKKLQVPYDGSSGIIH